MIKHIDNPHVKGGITVVVDGDTYWAPSPMQLREEGIRFKIRHDRRPRVKDPMMQRLLSYSEPPNKGGSTYILLLAPDGQWAEGKARCHKNDNYNKKVGYVLAVNHALSQLGGQLYEFDRGIFDEMIIEESEENDDAPLETD